MNLYGYTGNDPVNNVDPSGNAAVKAAGRVIKQGKVFPVVGQYFKKLDKTLQKIASKGNSISAGIQLAIEATIDDAGEILTGGEEPDRVTTKGTKIFDESPTGRDADDIMGDIKDLPGAEVTETKSDSGAVTVVDLPDESKVVDRNSSDGSRTVETQRKTENNKTKSSTKTRFPNEKPREKN